MTYENLRGTDPRMSTKNINTMYKNFLHNSLHDYLGLKQEYQVRFVNNFVDKVILLGTLVKYKYQKELLKLYVST